MKKIAVLLISIVLFSACQKDTAPKNTYIRGEIVNPFHEYITLFKDNKLIDTIFLEDNNTFNYALKEDREGLYIFKQSPESQIIYITPGDSILFHLNTIAFDESLYFSGSGAAKNNFLMELYLLNERNNDLVLSYYKFEPEKFVHLTDSIHRERREMFRQLQHEYHFSTNFSHLAENIIDYEFYNLRERYAFLIKKFSTENREIPSDFFRYREKVNFNDNTLKNHFIYQRFLDDYLKNRSIEDCVHGKDDRECFSMNSFQNLHQRILMVDSLFTLDVLKNRFYGRFGRQQIIFSNNSQQIDSALSLLKRLNYPEVEELERLAEVQRSYFIGNNVSHKKLIDTAMNEIVLEDVLVKPTITFSWSHYSETDHLRKHQLITGLRKKYPEVDFIGINIDAEEVERWKRTIAKFGYDPDFEFQNRDIGDKKSIYRNFLDRILFINKKGEIVFDDIPLDSPNFENYILEFLNK